MGMKYKKVKKDIRLNCQNVCFKHTLSCIGIEIGIVLVSFNTHTLIYIYMHYIYIYIYFGESKMLIIFLLLPVCSAYIT